MSEIQFTVVEIVSQMEASSDRKSAYIKVKDDTGAQIAFWGRPYKIFILEKDMTNINKINSFNIPMTIKIKGNVDLEPESYMKSKYGIKYSVSEAVEIDVLDIVETTV